MGKIVLLRHGESEWNRENRYTGWTDVDLTEKGCMEARHAGKLLKDAGFQFTWACTSLLKRAIRSLWIVLDEIDQMWLPYETTWRLNERHYGALQGLNKAESTTYFGEKQVFEWRRSYRERPPLLSQEDNRHPRNEVRYRSIPEYLLPSGESLEDTLKRVLPYWHDAIVPRFQQQSPVLVVAHGNSLRALVTYLDQLSEEEVPQLNIPTGIPLVYELSDALEVIDKGYLGDPRAVAKAEKLARQNWPHQAED